MSRTQVCVSVILGPDVLSFLESLISFLLALFSFFPHFSEFHIFFLSVSPFLFFSLSSYIATRQNCTVITNKAWLAVMQSYQYMIWSAADLDPYDFGFPSLLYRIDYVWIPFHDIDGSSYRCNIKAESESYSRYILDLDSHSYQDQNRTRINIKLKGTVHRFYLGRSTEVSPSKKYGLL